MLCGDGTAVQVLLDGEGRESRLLRSEKFFDVVSDPLTEKGVRSGKRWLFASFEGYLHAVDFSGSPGGRSGLFRTQAGGELANRRIQHLRCTSGAGFPDRSQGGRHAQGPRRRHLGTISRRKQIHRSAPGLTLAFVRPLLGISEVFGFARSPT
jgi:hypothetical protein